MKRINAVVPPRARLVARLVGVAGLAGILSTCDLLSEPGISGIVITFTSDTTLVVGTIIAPSISVTVDGTAQSEPRIQLSSSDNGVVLITPDGDSLRVVGRGRATLRISLIGATLGDERPFFEQPVRAVADRVTLDTATAVFASLTDTLVVRGDALDALGAAIANTTIAWESTSDSVATVDAAGRIVSRRNGVATVYAIVDDDTASVAVVVSQVLSSFLFDQPIAEIAALTATVTIGVTPIDSRGNVIPGGAAPTPTWLSLDPAIATVNPSSGTITAVSNGQTSVTATAGTVVGTLPVSVDQRAQTIEIIGLDTVRITSLQEEVVFGARALDSEGADIGAKPTWSSSNSSVAQVVDPDGVVRALTVGNTVIEAKLDLATDTVFVFVTNQPRTVTITPDTAVIETVGDSVQFTATVRNGRGDSVPEASVSWRSLLPDIVQIVDNTGLATTLLVGTVRIIATVNSTTIADTAVVATVDQPATVDIIPTDTTLASAQDIWIPAVTILNSRGGMLSRDAVDWSTDNGAVATVTEVGVITARGRGDAIIRATNPFNPGQVDQVTVTVTDAPASIDVLQTVNTLTSLERTQAYVATVRNARAGIIADTVGWGSSDSAVATISSTGPSTALATAVGVGSAFIIGTAGGVADTAILNVTNDANSVTISPTFATLGSIGETQTLTATVLNELGNPIPSPTVTWTAVPSGIVTVSGTGVSGLLTAVGEGSATVSATVDGVTASILVTVNKEPTVVLFTSGDTTLASVDDSYLPGITIQDGLGVPLGRGTVDWSTADPNIVSVSGTGLVTAKAAGDAVITATSPFDGTLTSSITVTVTNAPASIVLDRTRDTLTAVGLTLPFAAEVRNAAGGLIPGAPVTWSSTVPRVATMSVAGVGSAKDIDTTLIVGTTANGLADSSVLVVTNNAQSISISPAQDTIENLGAQLQLTASAPNELGAQVPDSLVNWASLNLTIATVDANGLVTASLTNTGAAQIVAWTNPSLDSVGTSAFITVADAPQTVLLTSVDTTLASIGDAYSPGATITNGPGGTGGALPRNAVLWESGATSVATVSGDGVVAAAGVGSATITITSPFNPTLTSSIVVTVTNAPDAVLLAPGSATLTAVGRTLAFSATVVNAAGGEISGTGITWGSTDSAVATISPVGLATAISTGTVTITAAVTGTPAVVSLATLVVQNNAATMTLSPTALSLGFVGDASTVTATVRNDLGNPIPGSEIFWSTNDAGVVTVPATSTIDAGLITAAGTGTATLFAQVLVGAGPDSVEAQITVSVSNDPVILDITSVDTTLTSIGAVFTPGTNFRNGNNDVLTPSAANWITSNGTVATVSTDGEVTAQAAGTTFIKAVSPANVNLRDSILVTVENQPDQVTLNSTRDTLTATTQTLTYTATVLNVQGDPIPGAVVSWNSSDDLLVSVDGSGTITALAFTPDSVEISATSGLVTSAGTIVAVKNPTAIYVDKDNPASPRFGTIKAPYAAIQNAIDAADPGDTVYVAAASTAYSGALNVSSSIIIQGIDTVAAGCSSTACATPTALPTIRYNSGPQGITAPSFTTVTLRHLAFQHAAGGPAVSTDGATVNLEFFYVNPAGPPTIRGRGVRIQNVTVTGSGLIRRSVIQHVNGYGVRLDNVTGMRIDSVVITDVTSLAGVDVGAAVHVNGGSADSVMRNRMYLNNVGARFTAPTSLVLTANDIFDNDSLGAADLPGDNGHLNNWWGDGRGPRRDLTTFTSSADSAATGDSVVFVGVFTPTYTGNVQLAPTYPASGGPVVTLRSVRGDGQVRAVIGTVPFALTARTVDADQRPINTAGVTFTITVNCDAGQGPRDDINDDGPKSCGPLVVTTNTDGLAETTLGLGNADGTRTISTTSGAGSTTFAVTKFSTVDPTKTQIDVSAGQVVANGVSTSIVTVTLFDATNTQLPNGGDGVELFTTAGSLGAITDNNDGTYTATLTSGTAAPVTATVTGAVNESTITDNATVNFVAGAAVSLDVTGISDPVTAGTSSGVTVTARDVNGNVDVAYTGTVAFTSSDVGAGVVLPANYLFTGGDAGIHVFPSGVTGVTLVTAGEQSVTATDNAVGSINGTQSAITVNPDVTASLGVTGISDPIGAGVPSDVTVTARDLFGNVTPAYTGTVTFSSVDVDVAVVLPANYTFTGGDAGIHVFSGGVELVTLGEQSVTATDNAVGTINGTQSAITVVAGPAVSLDVTGISDPVTAGASSGVTVTARDEFGNVATGYTGTVAFTSSDVGASVVLPANYLFTGGDAGIHVFPSGVTGVTVVTAGEQSVTATDNAVGSINGTQSAITVNPDATASLGVTGISDPIGAGVPSNVTVTARDQFGNVTPAYTGTVTFSSSDVDVAVVLPANYTFTGGDAGIHSFSGGVELVTLGEQSVTATDNAAGTINGTQSAITVVAGPAVSLDVTGISDPLTAGATSDVIVTARDQFGNVATGYTGTIVFTTTDPGAVVLPGDFTFVTGDAGVHLFAAGVTLQTPGEQTVTATDTLDLTINGTQTAITVP